MTRRVAILLAALALLIPYPAASDVPIAASAISGFEAIRTAGITVVGTSYPTPAVPQLRTIAGTGLKGDEGTGKPSGNPSQGRPDGTHRTPGSASTFRTLSPAPSPAPATLAPSARAVPRLASVRSHASATVEAASGSAPAAATVTGTASWFRSPAGVSAAGPGLRAALGEGWRGTRVTVTGPAGSAVVTLGDWMRRDRLIDLDAPVFVRVCGALALGICRVTVTS